MKKFIFTTICIGLGLFLAQNVFALTISPPKMELSSDSGERIENVIKIYNETDKTILLYTSTADFTAKKGEEGVPEFLVPGEKEDGFSEWIGIEKGPISILPSQRKEIPFVIDIPDWADPGGHYAGIFFGTSPPKTEDNAAIGIAGKVGSLILLRVSGDINEEGRLTEFYPIGNKKIYERLPINFAVGFENSGNVHLKPQGEIIIKNIFGQTSGTIEINKGKIGGGGNVLPETARHFEGLWQKNPMEKEPKNFLEKLKAEKNNFALGRYKANLNLSYGAENKKANASVIFWVMPWRLILVFGLALVLLIFLIILGIKRYNRWIIGKAREVN